MANEGLQYDLSVNFEDYEKSLSKYMNSTITTNKKVEKSYEEVDKSVDKLSATQKKEHDAIVRQGAERRANAAKLMDASRKRAAAAKIAADKIVRAEKKIADAATITALKIKNLEARNKKLAIQTEKARLQNDKLNTSLTKTTKTSGSLSKTVKTLAGAYLGFAAARKLLNASFQLGGKILDESGQLETATEKWRIFKGSADEAATTIKDLFEFSNRTPFTFKDVNAAATQLFVLTDGALQGSKAMEQMGDRAAMAKVPMSQLTTWWGRLYAGMQSGKPIGRALTRMQQLGIVSGTLRNKLDSLSKDDMMSGKGWEMFIEGTSKADGMISELAKTIEGKKSTLSGVWDGLFALEGQNLDVAKDQLDNIIKALNDNKGLIQDFFSFSLEVFSASVNGAMSLLKGYMSYVDRARNVLAGAGAGAKTANIDTIISKQSKSDLITNKKSLSTSLNINKNDLSKVRDEMIVAGLSKSEMHDIEKFGATNTRELTTFGSFDKEQINKLRVIFAKNNEITAKLNATNKYLALKIEEEKKGTGKTTSNGFTGLGLGGNTGKTKSLISSDPFLEKMFPDTGGDPDDYELLSTNSNYTPEEFKTRKGDNNIYKEDADRRLALITEGWDRSMVIQEDTSQQMLDAQIRFYQDSISIIGSSENTIMGMHEVFTSQDLVGALRGLSNTANGASNILGTLGLVGAGGVAGIAGGLFSLGSTIAGFFGGDDDSGSTQDIEESTVSARANIVSSGVETVNLTVNFTNYSTYTNEEGLDELINEELVPRLKDAANGAYA